MEAKPVLLSQLASTIPISITEIVQDYNLKKKAKKIVGSLASVSSPVSPASQ